MCKFVNVPIVLFEDVFEPRRHEEHKGTQRNTCISLPKDTLFEFLLLNFDFLYLHAIKLSYWLLLNNVD